jgi:hypothetical protein
MTGVGRSPSGLQVASHRDTWRAIAQPDASLGKRSIWKAQYRARSLPHSYGSVVDKLRGLAYRLLIVNALDHGRGDVTVGLILNSDPPPHPV